jgi:hypothetical protein
MGGGFSFIQDRGVLRHAATASSGYYLFSEVGAGVQPLALIGLWHEVLNFLVKRSGGGIDNRIVDLPQVYMGLSYYQPGKRFTGLFPVGDAAVQLTKGAMGFVPGNNITDAGGAIGDLIENVGSLFKKTKTKTYSPASNEVYVKFSYLPEEGMAEVGSGKVSFQTIYPHVQSSLSSMGGV